MVEKQQYLNMYSSWICVKNCRPVEKVSDFDTRTRGLRLVFYKHSSWVTFTHPHQTKLFLSFSRLHCFLVIKFC